MSLPTPDVIAHVPEEAETTDPRPAVVEQLLEEELLVEDISIDGMCGVY